MNIKAGDRLRLYVAQQRSHRYLELPLHRLDLRSRLLGAVGKLVTIPGRPWPSPQFTVTEERKEQSAMNRTISTRFAGALILGVALNAAAATAAPRVIQLKGSDDMKYSMTKIQATAGEELKVVLTVTSAMAKDAMAHNFLLLDPAIDLNAFITKAAVARKTNFVPASFAKQILAQTPLAGNGETVEVIFKAPAKPGTYPYVCSFPGHYAGGMKGDLIVK